MDDPLSAYCGLTWEREHVKVRRVATESRSQDTLIKIELVVSDGYALSHILRDLDDAKRRPAKPTKPAKLAATKREPSERLALPAPPLQLGYIRGDL